MDCKFVFYVLLDANFAHVQIYGVEWTCANLWCGTLTEACGGINDIMLLLFSVL